MFLMVHAFNFLPGPFANTNLPATSVLLTLDKSITMHKITAIFTIFILNSKEFIVEI